MKMELATSTENNGIEDSQDIFLDLLTQINHIHNDLKYYNHNNEQDKAIDQFIDRFIQKIRAGLISVPDRYLEILTDIDVSIFCKYASRKSIQAVRDHCAALIEDGLLAVNLTRVCFGSDTLEYYGAMYALYFLCNSGRKLGVRLGPIAEQFSFPKVMNDLCIILDRDESFNIAKMDYEEGTDEKGLFTYRRLTRSPLWD